jgi:hypothetical protein
MKFNKHVIIEDKFMNGDKIFCGIGNMESIIENKVTTGGGNNRSAKTRNLHTCPISRMDLIGAIIGIVHSEFVELTNNVVGGTRVGVPIVVGAV